MVQRCVLAQRFSAVGAAIVPLLQNMVPKAHLGFFTGYQLSPVNLVVHYRVSDPTASLFRIGRQGVDGSNKWDTLVRDVAEASLHAEMSGRAAEDVLGLERADVERQVKARLEATLEKYCRNLFSYNG